MTAQTTNPTAIDLRTRETTVTLGDLRSAIPSECFHPNPRRAWLALGRVLATVALSVWALSRIPLDSGLALLWEVPAMAAVWIVYGWTLVGLFVIGHDCGHDAFSRRRWVNTAIGHLAMAPLANNFHSWRLTHNHHHAYTLLRGQEVDWASRLVTRDEFSARNRPDWLTRAGYAMPFGVALWIGWNMIRRGFTMKSAIPAGVYARERNRLYLSSAIMTGVVVGIYCGLWSVAGFWGVLKFYSIPAAIAAVTGTFIITIQHANERSLIYDRSQWTPLRGQIVSTFDVRFPSWIERLWFHINTHIPHHLAPGIPWYHLKTAANRLRAAFPEYYQEQPFSAKHLVWWRKTPFLKRVEDKGYYALEGRAFEPGGSAHRLSRAVIVAVIAVSMGLLFYEPASAAATAADVLLRAYAMFIGTVMAHEAIHGHLGRGRAANLWWGRVALLPVMVPFTNFRKTHLLHHAHTNLPDKDPDYFVRPRNPIEIPLRALAMPHAWFFWLWKRGRVDRGHVVDLILNYAGIAAVYGAILLFVSPARLIAGTAPALVLVSLLLWYPFAIKTHEGFSTGSPEARSHNYYGRFMYWFSLGLSAHRAHHLHPRLNWLELRSFVVEDSRAGLFRRVLARTDMRLGASL